MNDVIFWVALVTGIALFVRLAWLEVREWLRKRRQ